MLLHPAFLQDTVMVRNPLWCWDHLTDIYFQTRNLESIHKESSYHALRPWWLFLASPWKWFLASFILQWEPLSSGSEAQGYRQHSNYKTSWIWTLINHLQLYCHPQIAQWLPSLAQSERLEIDPSGQEGILFSHLNLLERRGGPNNAHA